MMKAIPEAELIINPDGSIYHLNLKPGEIANTIITVGDPERVNMVSRQFDNILYKAANREFVTHTGELGGKLLTVISTGIGTDNVDIVLNELDALVNIDFEKRIEKTEKTSLNIIRIGTSGGLQADIPLDSFVISAGGLGMDGLLHFYNYPYTDDERVIESSLKDHLNDYTEIFQPYFTMADTDIVDLFPKNEFKRGITATCTGFYGPQGRKLIAKPRIPKIIDRLANWNKNHWKITNFEMETAGILGMGKLLGHKCTSLNAIVAQRHDGTFSKNPSQTIEKLIEKALPVILAFK